MLKNKMFFVAGATAKDSVEAGSLYSWGLNDSGRTALGTNVGLTLSPTQVGSDTDWLVLSAGSGYSHGIKANGALYSWGNNANGRTGLGTDVGETLVPTQVGSDTDWVAVSAGGNHSHGIKANGALYSWGNNANGRTGLGTDVGLTLVPTQVGSATDWIAVTAGVNHGHAIKANGALYSWGNNVAGRTALGTDVGSTLVPTQVGSATDWLVVSAGAVHSHGIKSNGALYSWGSNTSGQTGLGTNVGSTLVPTQVGSDTDWLVVSAGGAHSHGIKSNGALYSWGSNDSGRTALGTDVGTTLSPTQVGSDTDWLVVSAGDGHGHAIKES